jgi:hypothetical protein
LIVACIRKIVLSFNKYLTGILYGVFVNLGIRFLILPLTPLPQQPFELSRAFIDWVLFGIVFGVPVVYNADKYYADKEKLQLV